MNADRIECYINELQKSLVTRGMAVQIKELREKYLDEYDTVANAILMAVEKMGYDPVAVTDRYIMDYLVQLDFFLRNGEYGHGDYDSIRTSIYDNQKTMLDVYMPGLLIEYICTKVMYEKFHFYHDKFLSRVKKNSHGVEVGFGEGFYLWNLYRTHPGISLKGYDISLHAKKFASDFLRTVGVPDDFVELCSGDIRQGINEEDASADYFILAEVIEHLPDPSSGVREIARILKKGGVFYLTTVIDSNHMDHMVNFKDVSELDKLFSSHGLRVEHRLRYKVSDEIPNSRDPSIGLGFVGVRV